MEVAVKQAGDETVRLTNEIAAQNSKRKVGTIACQQFYANMTNSVLDESNSLRISRGAMFVHLSHGYDQILTLLYFLTQPF